MLSALIICKLWQEKFSEGALVHIQPSSAKTLDCFLPLMTKFFSPAEAAILEDTLSVNQTRQQSVYRSVLGADSRVLYRIREAREKHLFAGGWIFQCK